MVQSLVSLAGLIGGLVAAIIALLYVRPTRAKIMAEASKMVAESRAEGAEASKIVAEGATILLLPLQKRVVELEHKLEAAQDQIVELTNTIQEERRISEVRIMSMQGEAAVRDTTIIQLQAELRLREARIAALERQGENGQAIWTGEHDDSVK